MYLIGIRILSFVNLWVHDGQGGEKAARLACGLRGDGMKLNVEDRGLNAKRWALIGAVVAALGGCGGGGDEQLTLNSESASNAASAQGYVAVGQVVANAMVEVTCAAGDPQILSTGADGRFAFAFSERRQQLPCVVKASGGTVNGAPNTQDLYSLIYADGRVNVTTVTTLLVAYLASEDPADFYAGFVDSARNGKVSATTVAAAAEDLQVYLSTDLGLAAASALEGFNPVSGVFEASATDTHDQLLEAFAQKLSTEGLSLSAVQSAVVAYELPPCSGAAAFCWPVSAYKALLQGRMNEKGEPETKFHEHDVNITIGADGAWAKAITLKSDKIGKIQNFDVDVVGRGLSFGASYHATSGGDCSYATPSSEACFEAVYGAMLMVCGANAGDDFVLMPAATVAKDSPSEIKSATSNRLYGLVFDRVEACARTGSTFSVSSSGYVSDESDSAITGLISNQIGKNAAKTLERKFWLVSNGTKSKYIGIESGTKGGQPHFVVLVQR